MGYKTGFAIKREEIKKETERTENTDYLQHLNRLSAIEYEEQNAELCDYVVSFDTYADAVDQICNILGVEE